MRHHLAPVFDTIFISSRHELIKPHAETCRKMLDLLHVLPQEAVFIDDRHIHVDGAMSIGMKAVRFTEVAPLRADLAGLGVTVDSFC